MKAFVCCCLLLLAGCVSAPLKPTQKIELSGQVQLPLPLTQAAHITLQLYAMKDGSPREIGRQSYRVSMLPLQFSFSMDAPDQAQGELLLKGKLSWSEQGVDQALSWQPVVSGREVKMVLKPLACYPGCGVKAMPGYKG